MALNAASHNPTGEKTGPTSGPPPQASSELKAAISRAANADTLGQHTGGQDGGDKNEGKKVKSEKELEKERKKAEKAKKFAEKQAKSGVAAPQASSKAKEKKKPEAAKVAELPEYVEETPGEKKILKPLDDDYHKAYNPKVVESAWYEWAENQGFFKPEVETELRTADKKPFVIPIPPPNVTGALHMGHALTIAIQDTLIRWNRMLGRPTLYVPGCDHAGIATQQVVENMLWRRRKETRHSLGRTAFVNLVQEWKVEYHKKITNAIRRMGTSVDWSRERFTMDDGYQEAVVEAFVRLHEEGFIYRANRLVNWCTKLNTALSNVEVVSKELEGRTLLDVPGYDSKIEFGVLHFFLYPIDGTSDFIEVATTRVETMLGDSGIAVNPNDPRFSHLVGKKARHPFLDRLLPIFADEYVDAEFGTGAVKITPAHDPNDFILGERHKLDQINILTDDGFMNENTGSFQGMKRFDARYEVIAKLKEKRLYSKAEDNPMKVPICDRSKDVIEPLIRPQWWMRMKEVSAAALKVAEDGQLKIRPETGHKGYVRWLSNLQDWCLSRQLYWGHRIPAYHVDVEGEDTNDESNWVVSRDEASAEETARKRFPGKNFKLRRDEDVLDTWFSSSLFPFATLGWPKKTADLANYYPTSLLETGWDILPFWVIRQVLMGIKLTGKAPFSEVYLHNLVRDSEGRKMSKSLGNVIDPIDVMEGIELEALHEKLRTGNLDPKELATATKYQKTAFPLGIPEIGADALRMGLISYTTGGGDINLDIQVIHGWRKFCNKVYQATKYVLGKVGTEYVPAATSALSGHESLAERWILRKFTIASRDINAAFENREFSNAASIAYQFWYTQLCDVFIENSKSLILNGTPEEQASTKRTLYTVIDGALRMIHPFMPFLTEELWQRLPKRPGYKIPSIMLSAYPSYDASFDDRSSEEAYDLVLSVSKGVRSLTSNYAIKENGTLYIQLSEPSAHETCVAELQSIRSLSGKGVGSLSVLSASESRPASCIPFVVSSTVNVYLNAKGHVDMDAEIMKAKRKMEKAGEVVRKQRKMVQDKEWQAKVNESVQEGERKKLADAEAEVREMEGVVAMFERLKVE